MDRPDDINMKVNPLLSREGQRLRVKKILEDSADPITALKKFESVVIKAALVDAMTKSIEAQRKKCLRFWLHQLYAQLYVWLDRHLFHFFRKT